MNYAADGRHFLYSVFGGDIYVAQLDGTGTKRLIERAVKPMYVDGYLVFVRQGTLFAQRFDPVRLELAGNPFTVAERIPAGFGPPLVALSASAAGPFVYRSGSGVQQRFAWFDRSGKEIGKVGPGSLDAIGPSLSPDDRRIALFRLVDGNADVWLLEL